MLKIVTEMHFTSVFKNVVNLFKEVLAMSTNPHYSSSVNPSDPGTGTVSANNLKGGAHDTTVNNQSTPPQPPEPPKPLNPSDNDSNKFSGSPTV